MYVSDTFCVCVFVSGYVLFAINVCLFLGFFFAPLKESIVEIKTETLNKRHGIRTIGQWFDCNVLIKTTLFARDINSMTVSLASAYNINKNKKGIHHT
jgi:hypothetical protein